MSTRGVAQTFLQRFFARHSFKAHDRLIVAATCIFLAGKVEETRVSLQDIIKRYFQATKEKDPQDKGKIGNLKERILVCERVLLHTIAFQLSVQLPFFHIRRLSKLVLKDDEKNLKALVQAAWAFATDSLKTDLCLQFHEASIAAACVYMGISYLDVERLRKDKGGEGEWWKAPDQGVTLDEAGLQSICLQILEIFDVQAKKASKAPPTGSKSSHPNIDSAMIRQQVLQIPIPVPALSVENANSTEQSELSKSKPVPISVSTREIKRPNPSTHLERGEKESKPNSVEEVQRDVKRLKSEH